MFLENKYSKWYFKIIDKRLNEKYAGYAERHHIIPKSLGGGNTKENIVALSAKEHFIVHLLLTEMCKDKTDRRKMRYALKRMMGNRQSPQVWTSGQYNIARIKNHKALLGRKFTEEHKQKIAESNKGQKRSKEARQKMSDIAKKRTGDKNPFYGKTHKKETKEKISKANTGKIQSEEIKLRKSMIMKNKPKIKCEYCNRDFDAGNYKKSHGEKCRMKGDI